MPTELKIRRPSAATLNPRPMHARSGACTNLSKMLLQAAEDGGVSWRRSETALLQRFPEREHSLAPTQRMLLTAY